MRLIYQNNTGIPANSDFHPMIIRVEAICLHTPSIWIRENMRFYFYFEVWQNIDKIVYVSYTLK